LLVSGWGDEDHALDLAHEGMGERAEHAPLEDPNFLHWLAKIARSAATPLSLLAFDRMWFDTDARDARVDLRLAGSRYAAACSAAQLSATHP
jgi:hypothetical protein